MGHNKNIYDLRQAAALDYRVRAVLNREMEKVVGLTVILLVWASAFAIAAPVPLVDDGTSTFDPNSGFRWLDVTQTVGRSYDDVNSQLGPGGEFDGYRFATSTEVINLYGNAGITAPWQGNQPATWLEYDRYFSLMTMLGMTRVTSDSWETFGQTAERTAALLGVVGLCEIGPSDCYFALASVSTVDRPDPWRGSFLVLVSPLGGSDVSSMPIPAALPLFATGLGLLGYFCHWRRKTAVASSFI